MAVFIPGVLEGSPTYKMMDDGVREAAGDIPVKTIEGGFSQAEWGDQLMLLASEGQYDLIVSSNAAMPELARQVTEAYPDQEFLILDGSGIPQDSIATVAYNHQEQAFLMGYFAGMATAQENWEGINPQRKVGLIVGQEYPQMNDEIRPGFVRGLKEAHPDTLLEFRVLGNWYDVEKARELAAGLYDQGVDIILTIAGGANLGVVAAAESQGGYVLWFDSDEREQAPSLILASAVIHQEKVAKEMIESWREGNLKPGDSFHWGIADGYIDFTDDGPYYSQYVPEPLRKDMGIFLEKIRSGSFRLADMQEQ